MTEEPRSIEEMLAADDDREPLAVRAALDAITCSAREDDVTVTVDLHGKLVGLDLGPRAMALRPSALASRVHRLADSAARDALAAGLRVLADVLGEPVAAELAAAGPTAGGPATGGPALS